MIPNSFTAKKTKFKMKKEIKKTKISIEWNANACVVQTG